MRRDRTTSPSSKHGRRNASNVVNSDVRGPALGGHKGHFQPGGGPGPLYPAVDRALASGAEGYKFTGSSGLSLFQMTTGQWIYDLKPAN